MMTCSIPAATASSTAYWMIGLSTSGSISFGWALVAGRKRVPHPAAGKTAFRTRIEPHGDPGVGGSRQYSRGVPDARSSVPIGVGASVGKGVGEPANSRGECRGPVEIREVRRPGEANAAGVLGAGRERCGEQPERQVELAVEDERPARVRSEPRREPFARERPECRGATTRPEAAGDDRLGD